MGFLYHTSVSNHGGLFGNAGFSERRRRVRTLRWRALGARFGAQNAQNMCPFGAVVDETPKGRRHAPPAFWLVWTGAA